MHHQFQKDAMSITAHRRNSNAWTDKTSASRSWLYFDELMIIGDPGGSFRHDRRAELHPSSLPTIRLSQQQQKYALPNSHEVPLWNDTLIKVTGEWAIKEGLPTTQTLRAMGCWRAPP
jgi:hypothetical protein